MKSTAKHSIMRKKSESSALQRQATLSQLPLLLVLRAPLSASNGIHLIFPHSMITYDKKIPNFFGKKKTVFMMNLRVTFPLDQKNKEGDGSGTVEHPGTSQ